MFKKTLVCLDGSRLAEAILPYVIESCPVSGSEVILLRVITSHITIPPPASIHTFTLGRDFKPVEAPTSDMGEDNTLEPEAGPQLKEIEKEQGDAKKYLETVARPFRAKRLKVKTLILEGEADTTILDYAENNKVSLIALTSHGAGGLKRGILGRVAQFVLKEAKVPVLIVKPLPD